MDPSVVQFFLFISKLLNLHNTLLIMTEEETIPLSFCNGTSFPIICSQYPASESGPMLENLIAQTKGIQYYPMFISDGDHDDLITKVSKNPLLFTTAQVWVMPMRYASVVPLRLDNNIFFYDGNSAAGYSVHESYAVKGQNPVTSMLYQWHQGDTSLPPLPSTMDRRSNLNGAVLRDSWVTKTRAMGGVQGDVFDDILSALQAGLNFTLQYIPPKPGKFGRKLKNGTWNGLVGMLTADDIDLVAGLMLSKGRDTALDFAWPGTNCLKIGLPGKTDSQQEKGSSGSPILLEIVSENQFAGKTYFYTIPPVSNLKLTLFSSPSLSPRLNAWAYVNVFPLTAWVTGFATIIVAALCFSVSCNETISQSITLMGRLFLQIGYDMQIKGYASRGLLMTAALCLNMVFIYYTSELTADMTVSPKELSINSFEDVERLGYRVMGAGVGRISNNALRSAPKDSSIGRIYENKYTSFTTQEELYDMVRNLINGEVKEALIWSFASKETKGLITLDILEAINIPKTLAFDKNSELTSLFNHQICKMKESGVIHQIMTSKSGDPEQVYGVDEPVVIGYENVLFPFGWLALGSIIVVPVILGEMILGRFKFLKGTV